MTTYLRKLSNTDIQKWADDTLNAQELQQFNAAHEKNIQLWQSYEQQQLYTSEDILETCYSTLLESNIEVKVGEKITFAPTTTIYPEFIYWLDRYNSETGGDSLVLID